MRFDLLKCDLRPTLEAHNNDIFAGENVSWVFENNLKVIVNPNLSTPVTELFFFFNSSVYIEIGKCVETGKQVIFPKLNFLMLNYV